MAILEAFEIDGGPSGMWWDILENGNWLTTVEIDDFGDYLDSARFHGYDVLVNTFESWLKEIDDECMAAE